ncbi:MAG: amidohydrolase [Acidimicrobiales bacterium]|nr:amidohydrolase [Acidimicrobiales bacterium]
MTTDTTSRERLISADDHVDLSHDVIKSHLASKHHQAYDDALMAFAATTTNVRSIEANSRWRDQAGVAQDANFQGMGGNRAHAAAGRRGHTDPHERLADMDLDGVDASVTYCEVSAFRYLYMVQDGWKEATRAFNSALSEFASPAPERLVVSYQIPIHDIDAAIAEVQWAATAGCKSLQLPVFPAELGLPDYWESRYDPLWAAITETGLPICCHIGMNTALDDIARRDPTPQKGIFVTMTAMSAGEALGMWLLTGVFERFPELKVVFVEPGLGWVAWWLYIADDFVLRQGYDFPGLTELPSHYFHRNVSLTFIDEPDAVRHGRERLGVENIMWSSDYPHPVSSWPNSQAIVDNMFADVSAHERELVVSGNAARVWNL